MSMQGDQNLLNTTSSAVGQPGKPPRQLGLEELVLETVETLRQLTIVVENYQASGERQWFRQLNHLMGLYRQMKDLPPDYDIQLPMEIVNYIDDGKNPDLYLNELLQYCVARNDQTNGKSQALKYFKEVLEADVAREFPEEYQEYKLLKQKQQQQQQRNSDTNSNESDEAR